MTIESRNQLIDKLILSIRTENIDAFDENTQKGVIWFGESGVYKILNEELPLYLNSHGVTTLLKFMVHNNQREYMKVVFNLLSEVIKHLEKENLEFGKDYSFVMLTKGLLAKTKNLSKEPMIAVKKIHAEKVMSIYTDFAWSQISPYIRFIEGDV